MGCTANIKIVLVETSHPGNIGAVIRAMETMGVVNLVLVKPKYYPHPDIDARASNSDVVMRNIKVVNTLSEALEGSQIVLGTSARNRKVNTSVINARECGNLCAKKTHSNIAIVFGTERTGLTNEQLMECNYHVYIPANELYQSINLAHAVQIICYEIRMSQLDNAASMHHSKKEVLANHNDIEMFYDHLERVLANIKFLDLDNPKKLMVRLKRMFNRIHLEKTEVNILRGIVKSISRL